MVISSPFLVSSPHVWTEKYDWPVYSYLRVLVYYPLLLQIMQLQLVLSLDIYHDFYIAQWLDCKLSNLIYGLHL